MDFCYQQTAITMEELEKHDLKENLHATTPPPPTYISATCSGEQDISPSSKRKINSSSPKMVEKQNNHQASLTNHQLIIEVIHRNYVRLNYTIKSKLRKA